MSNSDNNKFIKHMADKHLMSLKAIVHHCKSKIISGSVVSNKNQYIVIGCPMCDYIPDHIHELKFMKDHMIVGTNQTYYDKLKHTGASLI